MPLFKRRRTLACKAEGTPGTIEALTAAEAAFIVQDAVIQQQTEMVERLMQGGFGHHPSIPVNRLGRATFKSHFYGGSASPAGWAVWLPGCGFGLDSGQYVADYRTPDTGSTTSKCLTIGSYQDGRLKRIHGAMGTAKFSLPAGKLAEADWDFLGIWNAPTDVALPSPTYPSLTPLRVIAANLLLGAYGSFRIANVGIDLGNTLYAREDVDAPTGIAMVIVTNRLVKVTLDPEAALVATKNIFGEWLAGTQADLSLQLSNGSDTCDITVSDLQIINPQEADRNGLEVDQIECQANTDDLAFEFAAAAAATPTPTPVPTAS